MTIVLNFYDYTIEQRVKEEVQNKLSTTHYEGNLYNYLKDLHELVNVLEVDEGSLSHWDHTDHIFITTKRKLSPLEMKGVSSIFNCQVVSEVGLTKVQITKYQTGGFRPMRYKLWWD